MLVSRNDCRRIRVHECNMGLQPAPSLRATAVNREPSNSADEGIARAHWGRYDEVRRVCGFLRTDCALKPPGCGDQSPRRELCHPQLQDQLNVEW